MNQRYELLYIVKTRGTDADLDKARQKAQELLERVGGTVTRTEAWGKRRLAYPIKRERFGHYELLEFDVESRKLHDLDRSLRLAPAFLRYQITRSLFRTDEEREAEMRRLDEVEARQRAREETTRREQAEEKPAPTTESQKKRIQEKEEKKITLEQLDEKIEEILKEESV